jgi:hypothetical protein
MYLGAFIRFPLYILNSNIYISTVEVVSVRIGS